MMVGNNDHLAACAQKEKRPPLWRRTGRSFLLYGTVIDGDLQLPPHRIAKDAGVVDALALDSGL